jgi:uncharacterized membrane protein YgcG
LEGYARERVPLVGSVQGYVMEETLSGTRPAAGVAVSLDGYRTAITDASGRYGIFQVPEGPHEVGLNMEQLPAEYEPGTAIKERVAVEPSAISRADFRVIRLTSLTGKVVAPPDVQMENLVIRLAGTKRYTTPEQDGSFGFHNLREGEYEVVFDERTLPEGFELTSPVRVQVRASSAHPPAPVTFGLKAKPPQEKPVREILQKRIEVPSPARGGGNGNGNGKGNHSGANGGSRNGVGGASRGGAARTNGGEAGSATRSGVGSASRNRGGSMGR